jgi:hypothetical protein
MTNKQIAAWTIISFVIFAIAFVSGADETYADGLLKFIYIASIFGFYTFVIWGLVKLFKSNE